MKIVFFGTPAFALPTLEKLLKWEEASVIAVVTQPDRPAGRGSSLTPPPVKLLAQANRIPVYQPERLRKDELVLGHLEQLRADFFVVVAYGQILSKRVLAMPKLGCINVHGSLLPKYRGAAPAQWSLYHGETTTGITTMLMDAGLDTGPMLLKQEVQLSNTINSEDLLHQLSHLGATLLIETLTNFETLTPTPQNNEESTYAPLITAEHLSIDWQQPALQIHNQIRAFYPQVHTMYKAQRLKVLATIPTTTQQNIPGTVTQILRGQGFEVSTGAGSLLVTQVQPSGKRVQSAWDFVNGARLQVGTILGI